MSSWDTAVIGAGVIGLAVGVELARAGKSVLVLERHRRTGEETSSRNSGVVHRGIYYPPGSKKSELCLRGRRLLLERCERLGIAMEFGKLIVAQHDEIEELERLLNNGKSVGVDDLELWDVADMSRREPSLSCKAALWSPNTAVTDPSEVVRSLRAELADLGGDLALSKRVVEIESNEQGVRVVTEEEFIQVSQAVNAAGLHADRIAASSGVDTASRGWEPRFVKGDYFAVQGIVPSTSIPLIYPLPNALGLGIHLTRSLGGQWLAGPDTDPTKTINYDINKAKAGTFRQSIATYFPAIRNARLTPAFSGIRTKLGSGDFVIERKNNVVHILGIESPGFTAALAIAEDVSHLLEH